MREGGKPRVGMPPDAQCSSGCVAGVGLPRCKGLDPWSGVTGRGRSGDVFLEKKQRQPWRLVLGRRGLAAIATAAAAVTAIAVLTVVFTSSASRPSSAVRYVQSPPHTSLSGRRGPQFAATVLLRAAHTAARQPATRAPGPDQFFYTKSEGSQEGQAGRSTGVVPTYFQPFTREMWISRDGSGE